MIAARYVPKEDLGVFVLIQVIASFFVMTANLFLQEISVTKHIVSVENTKKMEIANTVVSYNLVISILISAVILLSGPLIYYLFKSELLVKLLFYIPLYFFFSGFDIILISILQGFHRYRKIAYSQIINGVVKLVFVVLFLMVLDLGVIGLIYAFLISFAASVLYKYFLIPFKKSLSFNPKIFKELFKFGFPLGLNGALGFIFTKIDRFMIGAMISPIGVAYYEIASKLPTSGRTMYESFQKVFFPNMSELYSQKRFNEADKFLNNSIRLVSFLTIFAAFIMTLFQKELITLFFSVRYLESAPALSFLMISLSIGLIGNVLGTTLVALGQSDKPVKINIVDTVTNVLGNLIMIPLYGFMGAVYASLISRSITNPFIVWFINKSQIKLKVMHYLKPLIIFGICIGAFQVVKQENLIIKILFIALFLILCFLLSVIKRNDFLVLFQDIKQIRIIKKRIAD